MNLIILNEDGSIDIPLNQEYQILIGRNNEFDNFLVVGEKLIPKAKKVNNLNQIDIIRFEEYTISKNELIDNISNKNLQYLIYNPEGPHKYSILMTEDLKNL